MIDSSLNHEVGNPPTKGSDSPVKLSEEEIGSLAASIVNNAREKFPLANVAKVQLAEAWTEVVCRYGHRLIGTDFRGADAIDSVLFARKFSEETGVPSTKKQEKRWQEF
ncbi:MAG: hypothetical protein ACOX2O_01145 [Bdellovibrionota bacterium]|jgi:hypothetical protein